MTPAIRWTLVVGVLALATLAALLPVVNSSDERGGGEDLGPVRAAVDVQPCPEGEVPARDLRGVEAVCLEDGSTVDAGDVAGADGRPT
ncbi:hypothetical protein [Saccharomonospora sp. CUA-673]|uniref:hypothetical protein n=1 Tax=Saccharomonospora sp. CUA-673 TaxID=1904969 RepID=UPI0035179605